MIRLIYLEIVGQLGWWEWDFINIIINISNDTATSLRLTDMSGVRWLCE